MNQEVIIELLTNALERARPYVESSQATYDLLAVDTALQAARNASYLQAARNASYEAVIDALAGIPGE